jgi:hypothetical protein
MEDIEKSFIGALGRDCMAGDDLDKLAFNFVAGIALQLDGRGGGRGNDGLCVDDEGFDFEGGGLVGELAGVDLDFGRWVERMVSFQC